MIDWQPIETFDKKSNSDFLFYVENTIRQGWYCQDKQLFDYQSLEHESPCTCCLDKNEEPTHWAIMNRPDELELRA